MESGDRKQHQHQAEVCAGTHQSDYTFKEEDVPGLVEALAVVAYLWERIAVALRLSKTAIEECREKGKDMAMKLYQVLLMWVVDQHCNTVRATRNNLKTALASPLVQHPQLANELEDKLKILRSSYTLTTSQEILFPSGIKEALVKKYSHCPEVPRGCWPPIVSKTFITLALIETSEESLQSDYSIRGDADDVLSEKKIVKYEDMFKRYRIGKKVLILGRPGSGKTTLVHKIVRDWSIGKALQGAELVFLVSLRMLSSSCSLSEIIQKYCFNIIHSEQVAKTVEKTQGRGVCIVLDGFDEYFPSNTDDSVIFRLLEKYYLPDAMIIVTSRPAAASTAAEIFDDFYSKIEVFGFSSSQIMDYINHFPFSSNSNDYSEKLQTFLESHSGVLDLCYLPVNCAIICFIYDTEPEHLPDTQTQIYALFTRLIIIRQLTSKDISRQLHSLEGLGGQEAEDFKKLCSLAFDMTTNSQQVIKQGPINTNEGHSLGLVTTDVTAGLSGYENSFSFLHLTLQEFLAAFHISRLNQEEQMSVIEEYGGADNMVVVWKFYFGLVNFKTGLNRAEKLFSLVKLRTSIKASKFKVQWSYEAKQASICLLASSQGMHFSDVYCNYDISAIAYTMSMAASQGKFTTNLGFRFWGPGEGKLKMLTNQLSDEALECLEDIDFLFCGLSIPDIKAIADKLSLNKMKQTGAQGLTSLTLLRFRYGDIEDEGLEILAAGLDGNHVLRSLSIQDNYIGVGIGKLLKSDCHLYHLDLSGNNIGDEGAKAIAKGLKGNLTLYSIDLSCNKIGIPGVEALALVLQGNTLYLNLNDRVISSPNVSPDTATSQSDSSHSSEIQEVEAISQCNLAELNLSQNIWDGDRVAIISKFTSFSHLNLSGRDLDLPEAMAVMDYLANSDSYQYLQHLGLSGSCNNSVHQLKYNMKVHPSSGYIIDLSHNNIDNTKAVSVLKAIKNHDLVGGVYLKGNDIDANEDIATNLKEAFQHDRINRLIIFEIPNNYIEITASDATLKCPSRCSII